MGASWKRGVAIGLRRLSDRGVHHDPTSGNSHLFMELPSVSMELPSASPKEEPRSNRGSAAARISSGSTSMLKANATCATAWPKPWLAPRAPPRTCESGISNGGLSQRRSLPLERRRHTEQPTQDGSTRCRKSTAVSPRSATCDICSITGPRVMSLWARKRSRRPGPTTSLTLATKVRTSPKRHGHSCPKAPTAGSGEAPPRHAPSGAKSANSVSFCVPSKATSRRGLERETTPGACNAGMEAETTRTDNLKVRPSSFKRWSCGSSTLPRLCLMRRPPP
mmetsp:Transcript_59024/g.126864  ORF Transcript_59024/g.126864 Transcript_59024/m.126864 type:complete len:279 (-) Transcript_59024:140-976(-)